MDTEHSGLLVKMLARQVITDSQFRAIEVSAVYYVFIY